MSRPMSGLRSSRSDVHTNQCFLTTTKYNYFDAYGSPRDLRVGSTTVRLTGIYYRSLTATQLFDLEKSKSAAGRMHGALLRNPIISK